MPNPSKYSTILILLLCSQPSKAQRTIEWYEPDFDSAYAMHCAMYDDLDRYYWLMHINQFVSSTARKRQIRRIERRANYQWESYYNTYLTITEFSPNGRLVASSQYDYYDTTGRRDTTKWKRSRYTYTERDGGLAIHCTYSGLEQGKTYDGELTYFFNAQNRLDSIKWPGDIRVLEYDTLGRQISFKPDSWHHLNTYSKGRTDSVESPLRVAISETEPWDDYFVSANAWLNSFDIAHTRDGQTERKTTRVLSTNEFVAGMSIGGLSSSSHTRVACWRFKRNRLVRHLSLEQSRDQNASLEQNYWLFASRRRFGGWKVKEFFYKNYTPAKVTGRKLPRKFRLSELTGKYKYYYFK